MSQYNDPHGNTVMEVWAASVLPAEMQGGFQEEVTFELGLHDRGQSYTRTAAIKEP